MSDRIRWGVVGTGLIASRFAGDLVLLEDAEVVAVGSRAMATADDFADRFDVPRRYGSYEELVADQEVDAVYVSTPHPGHHAATRLALEAGKAVLCEKPFMLNAAEADDVIGLARERGVFLMEAMWTRFLPHMVRIREILAAGTLGRLVGVQADHGQWFAYDPGNRLFAPSLGGGALLDLGVYPVSFADHVLGGLEGVTAHATLTDLGVDATTTIAARGPSGALAHVWCSMAGATSCPARVVGTKARLEVEGRFYNVQSRVRLVGPDGSVLDEFVPTVATHAFRFEAPTVARALAAGRLHTWSLPWAATRRVMAAMDEVRRQVGVVYPGEAEGV